MCSLLADFRVFPVDSTLFPPGFAASFAIYIHIYQVSKQCRMQIETYLTRLDLTTNLSLKGSVSKARNGCTPSNPSRRRARRRCQPKRERRKRLST